MKSFSRSNRAFTLIELLTVIAIIALLAGLLFPAIKSAMLKSETTKAQVQISNLQTAFKSYYSEYGTWPVSPDATSMANSNYTYIVDTNFVALLQGANNTASLTSCGLGYPPSTPLNPVSTSTLKGNPRQIRFIEFKTSEVDPTRGYLDPWKQPYFCRFDVSYAGDVNDPFYKGALVEPNKVRSGFLIWSAGPNAQYDDNNTSTAPSDLNKDNLKSW